MEIRDEKFYKVLEPILTEINKECVRMDSRKEDCVKIAENVVKQIIENSKCKNNVFRILFSRIAYVGSYYDGLRVKEATEFDLNIIFKLPLDYKKIIVTNTESMAGFVRVNISEAKTQNYVDPVKSAVESWCDQQGYLQQNQVRSWLESVFTKTFGTGRFKVEQNECLFSKSGPAITLRIYSPFLRGKRIDVDLVFSLEFQENNRPPSSVKWLANLAAPWVIVPKQHDFHHNKAVMWRMSFPRSEQLLIHNIGKLKMINRFMKALRDSQNMNIASYYIKTVFLWEADKVYRNEKPRNFWEKNIGFLLVYGLTKMHEYLDQGRLPYYWHTKCNLFSNMSPDNLKNMSCRFKNIIKVISKFIDNNNITELRSFIFNLFKVSEITDAFSFENESITLNEEKSESLCSVQ